jgi:hypothetical protein
LGLDMRFMGENVEKKFEGLRSAIPGYDFS